MMKIVLAGAFGLALITSAAAGAASDPPKAWQDVRALVVRFNDAQNVHNVDVVGALLLDSPDFQFTAGPVAALGHDAAVNELAHAYQGEWRVLPNYSELSIKLIDPDQALVSVPTEFKTSPPGEDVVITEAMVSERAVRTPQGWRLASVDVEPAPAAVLF